MPAAAFLIANGSCCYVGERLRRRRAADGTGATSADADVGRRRRGRRGRRGSTTGSPRSLVRGVLIGAAQILALLPGISRSGVTMVAGLLRGLSHGTLPGSRSCWRRPSSWRPAC